MRSDRTRRLAELERGVDVSEADSAATAAFLDKAVAEFGHLVDWDLGERLQAVPFGRRAGIVVDWLLAIAEADAAAGAEVRRHLEAA